MQPARRAARRRGDGRRARARDRRARPRQRQGRSPRRDTYDGAMAVTAAREARRRSACAPTSPTSRSSQRQAGRVPRLGRVDPEAAPGARRDAGLLRAPRTRTCTAASTGSPSARPRATRARARRCARSSTRPSAREVVFTRSATEGINLVAYAWGLDEPRPRRRRRDHRARAPLELRPLAVRRQPHRRELPAHPDRRRRASCSSTRSTRSPRRGTSRSSPTTSSRTRSGRSTRSRSWPPGRTSRARSWSSTPRRRRRTGAIDVQALGCDFLAISSHKLCGPSGRRRALGQGRSCSSRCRRSTSAAR